MERGAASERAYLCFNCAKTRSHVENVYQAKS